MSLAVALEGYLFGNLNIFKRGFLGVGAFALLVPHLTISMIGLGMILSLVIWEVVSMRIALRV